MKTTYDVIVIGGGPAGMAAALAARKKGVSICLIERDDHLGGILRQCIHDGFGLIQFKERLTGPEYAFRYQQQVKDQDIDVLTSTYLLDFERKSPGFHLHFVSPLLADFTLEAKALVMAMGCRERTDRQIFIHGDRPSGIFTAGQAQNLINLKGYNCCKRCVILGSGDIGLIMARRLTLEGVEVVGVYEAKNSPGGLSRNIVQCLDDYHIPLHLGTTVSEIYGRERLSAVKVIKVDERMQPIAGSEKIIDCDALVLSVGLIPENDILEPLNVPLDPRTKGPRVDQDLETMERGIFSCGNALHVNDLVDWVSESGETAGEKAADFVTDCQPREIITIEGQGEILYQVPSFFNRKGSEKAVLYFRTRRPLDKAVLEISAGYDVLYSKTLHYLKPPEMERFTFDLGKIPLGAACLTINLREVGE